MSELREISGANVRLTPDQIRPPEGYVGFFPLFQTPQERIDMAGSPLLPTLSDAAIQRFSYVRIPGVFLSGTGLLERERELEEHPEDYNLSVVRRQMRSEIEQRLGALGWRKQHVVLPSLWYRGNYEPLQVAFLAQRVEEVGLKQVVRYYELGPGIYEPTTTQAPQSRFLETIHYDTGRLNRDLDVQYFNHRNSDHSQSGAAWIAQYRAGEAFTSINDRGGQWVLRKDVTAVRKYLYARFGALLDLGKGWIIVPSEERNKEIAGTKGKHIKGMCEMLRASNSSVRRLEIREDGPSYQRLHETYTSEGWISEHLERMAKEGYAAYPETTAHGIPGFDDIVHNLVQGQASLLAQNPDSREISRSYPYESYAHERFEPWDSITFTEETEMPESARQPGTWMQIETSSGSVYTFQVLTPRYGGIRVIGNYTSGQGEQSKRMFVGMLTNPMQGKPLSFSEFASIDPRNARETMRALHYEEKYSLESSAIRLMLEHYARYGEQWGIHPLNPSVITDGCLLKRETTPVAHIRIGHFEE